MSRPTFDTVAQYGAAFTDAAIWAPYVRVVCARHGISAGEIRAGLAGTFPTFIVDERYVVKLFGDLFDGRQRHAIELDVYDVLAELAHVPAPRRIADGVLFDDGQVWNWPYIISTFVRGASLGEAYESLSAQGRRELGRELGSLVRELHGAPMRDPRALDASGEGFRDLIRRQRACCVDQHREWGSLPERLIEQIDAYLPSADDLLNTSAPFCLIHADITEDHVLGYAHGGHWQLTGIIDYGDAYMGDPAYELVALHLGAFACDKTMLGAFLAGYADSAAFPDLVLRAMSYSLLHEFNVMAQVFSRVPAAADAESLEELADLLWNPQSPGLSQ
jgi:hygromycin-B 7''-O-kinase